MVVSKLNASNYGVEHHGPFLAVEGIRTEALEGLPGRIDHPSLTPLDRLVAEYAVAAWENSHRVPERLFRGLREHFSEAQIVELTLRITLCGFFNRFTGALGIDEAALSKAVE